MDGQRISLDSQGIKITTLYFKPKLKQDKYPAIIIAHGIPSTTLPVEEKGYDILAKELNRINGLNFITIIFNFRGCNGSGGLYSPLGWVQDLKAVLTFLMGLPEIDKEKIILLGFSAGALVSFCFTAKNPEIAALISVACPSDLSIDSSLLKRLTIGIKFAHNNKILRTENPKIIFKQLNEVNPLDFVKKIYPRPLLIVHGEMDELINVDNAHKLYQRAKNPKQLIIIKGAGHKLRQNPKCIKIIKDWILRLW
ncbi:MAG: alpha/beta hydrolase [Candidatus Helarchaeota archaeon]